MNLEQSYKILKEMKKAIGKGDTEKLYKILLQNLEVLRNCEGTDMKCSMVRLLFSNPEICDEKITLLLDKNLKFPTEDDYKYLKNIFISGNMRLAELIMRIGSRFGREANRREWREVFENNPGRNLLHKYIHFLKKNEYKNSVEIAEILINSGISVDETDYYGCTPLLRAIPFFNFFQHFYFSITRDFPTFSLIKFLIKRGADVNKANRKNESPLMRASEFGNLNLVDLLLAHGAEVNAKDNEGSTALHKACQENNRQVMSLLIQRGAEISVENESGQTPFSLLIPNNWNNNYDQCSMVMIQELSKLIFGNLSICKVDMDLILKNPKNCEYFEKCLAELEQMKNTNFYGSYSYYSVLKRSLSMEKLARLTKNEEIFQDFERNISLFPCYKKDLRKIFLEVYLVKRQMEIIEFRLNLVFGDFLPYVVLRKLADNLTVEDLPLELIE